LSKDSGAMTPAQCRAARALVDLSQIKLAKRAGLTQKTVTDFERGNRPPYPASVASMRRALERAGVQFLDAGEEAGGGPGVRLAVKVKGRKP
jgi:transcriptional regulator with XRE-family HTH domain